MERTSRKNYKNDKITNQLNPSVTGVAPGDKSGATVFTIYYSSNEIGYGFHDVERHGCYDCFIYWSY